MDLANQSQTGTAIHRGSSMLKAILVAAATVAIVAVAAGTIWVAGPESRTTNGPGTATGYQVSNPVYVEHRRDERGSWSGSTISLSDPVYVEHRRDERGSWSGSTISLSDPVYVEFRHGERNGS